MAIAVVTCRKVVFINCSINTRATNMSWNLSENEVQSVLRLEAPARYSYCIRRIADEQRLWSLRQDASWALASDDLGRELVPIWPHNKYASLCTTSEWRGFLPASIDIE